MGKPAQCGDIFHKDDKWIKVEGTDVPGFYLHYSVFFVHKVFWPVPSCSNLLYSCKRWWWHLGKTGSLGALFIVFWCQVKTILFSQPFKICDFKSWTFSLLIIWKKCIMQFLNTIFVWNCILFSLWVRDLCYRVANINTTTITTTTLYSTISTKQIYMVTQCWKKNS